MKEQRNVHLKVQELCDCYATNDPLKEMSEIKNDGDKEEAALKWLALAALHGVSAQPMVGAAISRARYTCERTNSTREHTDNERLQLQWRQPR